MYRKKVKKGKHCITYTLQLNLTKLNLFQSSVVKTLPCYGCFIPCMSAHFPVEKRIRRSDDSLWHGLKWCRQFDRVPGHFITCDQSVSM